MFIVLEGGDASGKDTQSKMLLDRFFDRLEARPRSVGVGVVLFHFPRYETPVGSAILRHLKGEIQLVEEETDSESRQNWRNAPEDALMFQCLMVADKYDAASEIVGRLREGTIVICNRWWQSGYAYGGEDGLPLDWLVSINAQLPVPDFNFLIAVDEEEALRRRPEARDRYEKNREHQAAVRKRYLSLWQERGWPIIDGTGTAAEVHERIWNHLSGVVS